MKVRFVNHRRLIGALAILAATAITLALVFQDTRLVATVLWAAGVMIVWAAVFVKAIRQWRAYRDRRALGEIRSDGALFIVAVAAGISIGFAMASADADVGDPLRQIARMFSAGALGAFLMAGVVKLQEVPPDPPELDVQGHRQFVARRR